MRTSVGLSLAALAALAAPAAAHFNMLLPQTASAKKGEDVAFTYQWGHPYEHQLFDAPPPESVTVLAPDGKAADLTKSLDKIAVPAGEGKTVAAYRFHFRPDQRGDYVFLLHTPPIWMEEDGEFLQDDVKVVLHVQAQKGWDNVGSPAFELKPLTRPYGLEPGMAFRAELQGLGANDGLPDFPAQTDSGRPIGEGITRRRGAMKASPTANRLVEFEHYHAAPPKIIPADEFCTRTARTDANGVVVGTLTDPGWWCLAAAVDGEMMQHDGKSRPSRRRSILWVWVDEKVADR